MIFLIIPLMQKKQQMASVSLHTCVAAYLVQYMTLIDPEEV